eukprot:259549_1
MQEKIPASTNLHYIDFNRHSIRLGDHRMIMCNDTAEIYNVKWNVYRSNAQLRMSMPYSACKTKDSYNCFIVAEFYANTQHLIPEKLRKSLLNELNRLSEDKYIKYDIRQGNSLNFLHSKNTCFENKKDKNCLIHELIDPNKYLFCIDHNLWIPTVINIKNETNCEILSDILNV